MNRSKFCIPALFILALASAPAFGAPEKKLDVDLSPSNWALGIFLGEPTGITVQLDVGATQALEVKAAWNFVAAGQNEGGNVTLQGNYVLWFPGLLVFDGHDIPPFAGIGVEARFGTDFLLGLHIPFGVRYRFREVPIELALELGAGMSLIPSTSFMGSGGLAIRWML
ncbi:MAG TPA: hypothetical protein P5117_12810 [Spirochaetia bacterium]|nr:hypothetical protein [Spirochaetales bacterium]HRY79353.1 hypothetical protein [Spirochaetia bacterium]HRZ90353.1 hypothetical protein [Spirochaetia bacterium]